MKDTILIIDDVELNCKILMECLGNRYDYLQASNGKEALEILEIYHTNIEAILLDIVMPIMDGYEFLSEFKKIKAYQEIPVIAMTGEELNEVEEKIIEAGAVDFFEKPYNQAIIRNRLRNTLNLTRALKAGRTDGLTGLLNRGAFRHEIETYLIENKKPAAVMIIDIDNFKRVNDVYGHFFGDKVLIEFANIMLDCCSENSAIGRLGGDEFIVLLKEVESTEQVKKISNDIINKFNKAMSQFEGEVPSCSIGISCYPQDGISISEIYLHADEALYNAKRLGKSKSSFYLDGQKALPKSISVVGKEWILESLNAYIYIVDLESNYLYYVNNKVAQVMNDRDIFVEEDITKCFDIEAEIKEINSNLLENKHSNKIFNKNGKDVISISNITKWGESNCAKIQVFIELDKE